MLTRNVQLNIRVTPEEKKLFEQATTRCGLTLSQYIRMRLHNQMPRQLPNADYRQVLDALTAQVTYTEAVEYSTHTINLLLF